MDAQLEETTYGVGVVISDGDRKPLYVVLSAWYPDGRQMWRNASGCSKGYIVKPPFSPYGEGVRLFCGKRPDFANLVVQVTIWELPQWESKPEDIVGSPPVFVSVVRRPDFDYSKEEFLYTRFAKVERKRGGRFTLVDPQTQGFDSGTSGTVRKF
jgi:hypothetical protein